MQTFCEADKTIFTFTDKSGDTSTLTLEKAVADGLQRCIGDAHAWIQRQYDGIIAGEPRFTKYIITLFPDQKGELSRRAIGDTIRLVASIEAFRDIDDSAL